MKKLFAFLLALVMTLSLVACDTPVVDTDTTTNPPVVEDNPSTSTPAEEEIGVEEVVFNPVTLVSNEYIVFSVTSEPHVDEFWESYVVGIYIENPTDKTIWVTLQETSVNDFMIDPFFGVEIAPGKKMNTAINFSKYDLDMNHIDTSIDKVAFKVAVLDSYEWVELYMSDEVSITFTE